jgi:hypothetical protein
MKKRKMVTLGQLAQPVPPPKNVHFVGFFKKETAKLSGYALQKEDAWQCSG